jgi:hypothetical protein
LEAAKRVKPSFATNRQKRVLIICFNQLSGFARFALVMIELSDDLLEKPHEFDPFVFAERSPRGDA